MRHINQFVDALISGCVIGLLCVVVYSVGSAAAEGLSPESPQAPVTSSIETCYNGTIVVEYYQGDTLRAVLQPLEEKSGKFSKVALPIKCNGG